MKKASRTVLQLTILWYTATLMVLLLCGGYGKQESTVDVSKANQISVSETTLTALPTETKVEELRDGSRIIAEVNKVQTTEAKTTFAVSPVDTTMLSKDLKVTTEGTVTTEINIKTTRVDSEGKLITALQPINYSASNTTSEMGELAQDFSAVINNSANNVSGLNFNLSSAQTAFEVGKLLQGATGNSNAGTEFSNAVIEAQQSGLDASALKQLKSNIYKLKSNIIE